jgi:DNA modification methylase
MYEWNVETRNISELRPHPKNPRFLSRERHALLKASLEKYGMVAKPEVNLDGQIIGGHMRIKIWAKLGNKTVPCNLPDRMLTPDEMDEACIQFNLVTGDWDQDILTNQWDVKKLMEYGFTAEQLYVEPIKLPGGDEDDDGTLEPGKDSEALTKIGDLYELGPHRIVCGDSTMPDVVEKCLGGNEPILMVTDPPYGVEYDPNWREKATNDGGKRAKGKVQNDDKVNWSLAWHLFPGSVAYIWHAGKYCGEVEKSLTDSGFDIVSQIIWVKQHFALSRGDYHWQHEPCWYAVKKGHAHNWQGSRKEATIWEISNLNAFGGKAEEGEERTAHSTQKPMECMAKPIRNNTAEGEGVYDPFLGSGTTLIAAEQNDRVCYGIELSPAYCDIIVKRWVKYVTKNGKDAIVKLNGELINFDKKME